MGNPHLARHGQASFGADIPRPAQPWAASRRWYAWANTGTAYSAVDAVAGHAAPASQTLEGIAEGHPLGLPPPSPRRAWNEYDSLALIRAIHNEPLQSPTRPSCTATTSACCATYRAVDGKRQPSGMPSWTSCGGVRALSTRCATTTLAGTCCWSQRRPHPPPWARCWAPRPRCIHCTE